MKLTDRDIQDMRIDRRDGDDILDKIKDPEKWNEKEVIDWLEAERMPSLVIKEFERARIDGRKLMQMDDRDRDLQDMKLPRRDETELLDKIKDLARKGGGAGGGSRAASMTDIEVEDWLIKNRMHSDVVSAFRKARIDGRALVALDERALDDMRIDRRDIKDLLNKIDDLKGGGTRGASRPVTPRSKSSRDLRRDPPRSLSARNSRREEMAEIVFQFGAKNVKSTRTEKLNLHAPISQHMKFMYEKYLVGRAKLDEIEFVFKNTVLKRNSTLYEDKVRSRDRIIIRKSKY